MDVLDRQYRRTIGADAYDKLLENRVHLDLLLADRIVGHKAFGRLGGHGHEARTIVGSGSTPREAALALLNGNPDYYRPQTVKSALWALGEAMELLAEHTRGGPEHTWYKCKQPCHRTPCPYCDGGLAYCEVCKQGEAELEAFCPGSPKNGE